MKNSLLFGLGLFTVSVLYGYWGWATQAVLVYLTYTYGFWLNSSIRSIQHRMFVLLPWFLIYGGVIVWKGSYQTTAVVFAPMLSLLTIILVKSEAKRLLATSIVLSVSIYFCSHWFVYSHLLKDNFFQPLPVANVFSENDELAFSKLSGQTKLIYIWEATCDPCVDNLDYWKKVAKCTQADSSVEFVMAHLNFGFDDFDQEINAVVSKYPFINDHLLLTETEPDLLFKALKIKGIPSLAIIENNKVSDVKHFLANLDIPFYNDELVEKYTKDKNHSLYSCLTKTD